MVGSWKMADTRWQMENRRWWKAIVDSFTASRFAPSKTGTGDLATMDISARRTKEFALIFLMATRTDAC